MNNDRMTETKLSGERIFSGRVLRLEVDEVSLPDGKTTQREVIRHDGAVCVIACDEKGLVPMVSQFRYAQGRVMIEIPAGKLEGKDEDPIEAARRELSEETGYTADRMIPLGLYIGSPAILDEKIHLFAALGLKRGDAHPDDGEFLSVTKIPLTELVDAVLSGKIADGKTQAAVLRLHLMLSYGTLSLT